MNYDEARQREDDKRWDMTSMNDGRIHPIGYCHAWNPPKPGDWLYDLHKPEWDKMEQFKDKYHTDGHATAIEASDCYREYLLDNRLQFATIGHYNPCEVCGTLTNQMSQIDGWPQHLLCPEHANREEVEKLWPKGELYQSIHS